MHEMPQLRPWPKKFEETLLLHLPYADDSVVLTADLSLADHGLGSIEMIGLLISIEEIFEIKLPDSVLAPETFATPATLWRSLSAVLPASEPSPFSEGGNGPAQRRALSADE